MTRKKTNMFEKLASVDKSYLLDPSLDDSTGQEEKTKQESTTVRIDDLVPFKNHPFHVNIEDDAFAQLVESISENGVIYPIIVRPIDGTSNYEIIAGHCRVEACKQLGIETVPAKIEKMDDFLATVIMTHTNISGRDRISVSEKAKAYRMCMDEEKHQGKADGGETAEVIGAGKDSARQVYRYVRYSYLIPELLEWLDKGKIALQIGYELAFICEEGQRALYRFCTEFKQLPDYEQAKQLRAFDAEMPLSYEKVIGYLVKPKEKKTISKVSFKVKDISEYFEEGTDPDEMSLVIMMLLDKYKSGEVHI